MTETPAGAQQVGGQQTDADEDELAAAVADDTPLRPGQPGVPEGGDQGDGLSPVFTDAPPRP